MFGNLVKAAIGVATTPIDIVADVVTMGGALTDKDEPYTASKVKAVMGNIEKAIDPDE